MLGFEITIAMRYLRSRGKGFVSVISGFSLLGIALGVATLIIVMSVMNGFRTELMSRILGINGHITVSSFKPSMENYDELLRHIRMMPDISYSAPLITGQLMISSKYDSAGAMVRGMKNDDIANKSIIANNIKAGKLEISGSEILIGSRLAENLGVKIGDNITLISPQGTATIVGIIPRIKIFHIVGIFEIGMYEYDNSTVIIPFDIAQTYFRLGDKASEIEVMLRDTAKIKQVTNAIKEIENLRVIDWEEANAGYFSALKVERNVMFLILTLIIIVAAFNIISGLIMLVKDKARNIAIMRTMGATRGMMIRIFLICGSSIGFLGTISGIAIGVLFCLNIDRIKHLIENITGTTLFDPVLYFLSELPADLRVGDVVMIALMSFSLSILATIYPAWKASKMNPAQILRYE